MEERNRRILKTIDTKKGIGLEIGPLTSPVVGKEKGNNIFYLDHMSLEDLKDKYKDELPDLSKILPVDFVLKDDNLKSSVNGRKFDYIIASHVIEHIPNVVGWLQDLSSCLRPGGIISLAIPDKRYTFDIARKITTPAEIIGAYIDDLKWPSSYSMYDYTSNYIEDVDSLEAWRDESVYLGSRGKNRWSKDEAAEITKLNKKKIEYIDCHCYTFTPKSFLDIMKEMYKLGLVDLELCNFMETQYGELEFYVALKKSTLKNGKFRKNLPNIKEMCQTEYELRKEIDELKAQISSLENSSSWKVTKPLRLINKKLKK